ncbi:MAG TPA: SOS response-associated peptidase [Gemmata sp.]
MCARITITTTDTEIADLFGLPPGRCPARHRPRYNVAPSAHVPVVRMANGARELAELKWGLVPFWNTNPRHTGFVNARAETAPGKPAFRDPFRWRRCLIPANGFFEWKTTRKRKQPYFFRRAGGGVLAYAGIWDRWKGPDGLVETVALLTVPANELVRPFHERMPAIVSEGRFGAWLAPNESRPSKLLPLLEPYPVERLERYAVSERVNTAAADGPELLAAVPEPLQPAWAQPALFDEARGAP